VKDLTAKKEAMQKKIASKLSAWNRVELSPLYAGLRPEHLHRFRGIAWRSLLRRRSRPGMRPGALRRA
jgi:hypothetical protein